MKATHRYLLVIKPSEEVAEAITTMREHLYAEIGEFGGRMVIPHITLFFADLDAEAEGPIVEAIGSGVSGQRPFELRYDGITHFPDKRTIHIDPAEKAAIAALRVPIIHALHASNLIRNHIRETDHAHLTIAANLKPHQFGTAWSILAPHEFSAAHRVDGAVLLRRELRPGAMYLELRTFAR